MNGRRARGSLEHAVLGQLWANPAGLTPTEVVAALHEAGMDLAYTTVMTVLTRVHEKGLAERVPESRTYRYQATATEAELSAQRMRRALDETHDRAGALAQFVAELSARDSESLRCLLSELET